MPQPNKKSPPAKVDALESVAEELQALSHLDAIADNLSDIALALKWQAQVSNLSAIAEYGNKSDREKAVEALKSTSDVRFES